MKEKRWFIVLALLFLLVLPERALASSGTLDIITTGKSFPISNSTFWKQTERRVRLLPIPTAMRQ